MQFRADLHVESWPKSEVGSRRGFGADETRRSPPPLTAFCIASGSSDVNSVLPLLVAFKMAARAGMFYVQWDTINGNGLAVAVMQRNKQACGGDLETMGHEPAPPARKSDDQDFVLTNAARLFRRKGFEKTSLKEIAEACDMLPGSLYYRYRTKEALLVALMRRGVDVVRSEVEMAYASSDDPAEQLRLCINAHLRALVIDSDTVYVLLFEWRALGPEAREEIIALRDQYESLWAAIIETMLKQGVIRKDIDGGLLRLIGLGALNWVATWFDPNGAYTLDAIGDLVWRVIMDGVIGNRLRA